MSIRSFHAMHNSSPRSVVIAVLAAFACLSFISTPLAAAPEPKQSEGAFFTQRYPNLFKELLGKSDAEIQEKLDKAWQKLFYGDDNFERVYYPVGEDMAYVKDIGSDDVRSEGMSFAMMIAVQLDKRAEFDRLWRWTKKYMYNSSGPFRGYFAWHCRDNGMKIDENPASDGEEWFATALFFAAGRWGQTDYKAEAQAILDTMLHKGEENMGPVTSMFDPTYKQVVFVPSGVQARFTDPCYHLPAFYELWARWAARDNQFWKDAAEASRAFFKKAAHPSTGLTPDYAEFDGRPAVDPQHNYFRSDALRVASNVALDWSWFSADPWAVEQSNRLLEFFYGKGMLRYPNEYELDGTPRSRYHTTAHVAMNAVAALAATTEKRVEFVQALWKANIPMGQWRYFDGMLYLLGLLEVSGNFRIYPPAS